MHFLPLTDGLFPSFLEACIVLKEFSSLCLADFICGAQPVEVITADIHDIFVLLPYTLRINI